jgi:glycosyltransferase involved in cell wall biosynthesis
MMATSLKTLLVIPVFNHGRTLRRVTELAIATGLPVLVVDDGSTDGGDVTGLACTVLRFPKNRGKGAALLAGANYAADHDFAAMVTIDADGQHDPAEAMRLIEAVAAGSWPCLVIGARQMVEATVPRSSHFGRAFSNFWVRLECGAELPDTQSGLRLYPVRELLALRLTRCRYDFEIEAIVKAVWAGLTVHSVAVPCHYPPPGERISHYDKIIDSWRLTRLHTRLVLRRLLPLPYQRLRAVPAEQRERVIVRNPFTTLANLCREYASPFWLAVAVWLGIFLGALPLLACHTLVIIYCAHRLHLNKVGAVAASQLCMPPVVPVVCIEIGYFLRHGNFIFDFSWERWLLEIHHRLFEWLLGSLVIGPVLGLVVGFFVYWVAHRLQGLKTKITI